MDNDHKLMLGSVVGFIGLIFYMAFFSWYGRDISYFSYYWHIIALCGLLFASSLWMTSYNIMRITNKQGGE